MEYKCPCGKGFLRRKISNSEYNYKRPYYKCNTSEKDELRMCTCGRGYCRNAKINGRKHWVCGIQDRDACEFRMLVTSSWSSSGGRRNNAAAALFEKFEALTWMEGKGNTIQTIAFMPTHLKRTRPIPKPVGAHKDPTDSEAR